LGRFTGAARKGSLMALTHRRSVAVISEGQTVSTLRSQAQAAIATLQAIRDDTNVTNAKAVTYIKDEALILQRTIRVLIGVVT
jgi:hypothetical protein